MSVKSITDLAEITSGVSEQFVHVVDGASGVLSERDKRITAGNLVADVVGENVDDTPVDGATGKAISSNWAYDHENTLVSGAAPGHVSASMLSNQNYIINGAMDFWQRGTSQTTRGYGSDDRWLNYRSATGSDFVLTRGDLTPGEIPIPSLYYSSTTVTAGTGDNDYCYKSQRIENAETLAGEEVTFSFWGKASATLSLALEIRRVYGTGGSSAEKELFVHTFNLTTSWQRHTVTFTMPSVSEKTIVRGEDYVEFILWMDSGPAYDSRTNSIGHQSGTFYITGVQLERGVVATPFTRAGGTIGGELALCQRYYYKRSAEHNYGGFTSGWMQSSTKARCMIPQLPVTMRKAPDVSINGDIRFTSTDGHLSVSSLSASEFGCNGGTLDFTVASGTAGSPGTLIAYSDPAAYIDYNAELL